MKKNKVQEIFHNIGCGIFIAVGAIGIIRLIIYVLYKPQTEINTTAYLIFIIFEILLGIFALVELKKKYLIRRKLK